MSSARQTLDRLIAQAGPLYSLPAVAMQVVTLLDKASVDTRALKDCIERDPALTGKILRVVNSSLFGLTRQVSDLNQAIGLLGIKPLKLLVLGFSLPPGLHQGAAPWVLEWYWRHALTKAVAARQLCQRIWHKPGDEAFLAGLLEDVGILVLASQLGEPYLRLLELVVRGADLCALESAALGFDHLEVSRRLLQSWGLPPTLCAAPQEGAQGREVALGPIVALAEHAARWIAEGHPGALRLLLQGDAALGRPLDAAEVEELLNDIDAAMLPLSEVFHLPAFAGDRARQLIATAHRQLADVAATAAEDLLRGPEPSGEPIDLQAEIECVRQLAAHLVRPAAPPATEEPAPPKPQVAVAAEASKLRARLAEAVAAARLARMPLSLLLVSIGPVDEAPDTLAAHDARGCAAILAATCRETEFPGMTRVAEGEGRCGMILPDCSRREALDLAGDWLERARRAAMLRGDLNRLRLAAGIATTALVSKNFPAEALLSAADRCLYASQATGSGVAKSIEL